MICISHTLCPETCLFRIEFHLHRVLSALFFICVLPHPKNSPMDSRRLHAQSSDISYDPRRVSPLSPTYNAPLTPGLVSGS
ncbi:hypothetical protein CYLTODRAFT_460168 [Cylindrobasidium torrendii FP15055 ss-10]|uniref:Uncharacterized protein n=1 Tax=Cylindrobasidium torrendii FP15055 ss-10 TaxID=1314674 RepID=A0A0D7ARS7_9AGAR|nr:hypothetical protein CYLTODRAFT_460168 [Cylindrobasidium torrendii FP15055 ss-10]